MQRHALGNRWRSLRARAAEFLFGGLAGLALLILLGWQALPSLRALINLPFQTWHGWLLVALLGALQAVNTWQQAKRAATNLAYGWLGTSPWPGSARQQALRQALRWRLLLSLAGLVLLATLLLSLRELTLPASFAQGAALLLLAAPFGAQLAARLAWRRGTPGTDVRGARIVRAATHLRGLALLQAGWTPPPPRSWRPVAVLAMLALPADLGFGGGALALLLIAALLYLGRSFARFRRMCTAAAQWLATQPLAPRAQFRALALPMLRQQLWVVGILAIAACGSGLPKLMVVLASCAWLALLLLLALLAFASRHQPERYGFLVLPRMLGLGLLLQILPPAVPLLWGALLFDAAQRARRENR